MATNSIPPTQGANPKIKNPVMPKSAAASAKTAPPEQLLNELQFAVDQFLVSPTNAKKLAFLKNAASSVKARRKGSAI